MEKNMHEWEEITNNIKEEIEKNNICSIYYKGLLDLLKDYKKIDELKYTKREYIKNIIGFIYILESFCKVKNIENKFQGAILYLLYHLFLKKKILI